MVLKRLKLPKFFNGLARTCFYTLAYGCRKRGRNLKISAKMLFSWFRVIKTKLHHFWSP